MDINNYLEVDDRYSYLRVKVIPKSDKNELFSIMDDGTLKIRIREIPERWKANKELISFLWEKIWVHKRNIEVISWTTSQVKIIRIKNEKNVSG